MIRLQRITLREIHLPLVAPFRTSAGETTVRRILLLELHDADGTAAWSECVAESRPTYAPDTVDTCWIAISEWLAPRVLGATFQAPSDVDAALSQDVRGHRMARAAIEMGTWTLASMQSEQPLARLLARSATPRTHVDAGIALGMYDHTDALVSRAQAAAAEGYQRIKLKIAPGHDIEPLAALRAAIGPMMAITADANSAYSLADPDHERALTQLDTLGLTMIEQPLAPDDLVRHAALQRRMQTPICLDESITGRASTEDMLSLGSGRAVNLKPGRVGGFTEALAVHDLCERAGVTLWCGGMLETGIGRAANVALASLPGFNAPGDLSPSARYWAQDIVTPGWTMDAAGRVRVPLHQPGLGVAVSSGRIDDLTVRSLSLGAR